MVTMPPTSGLSLATAPKPVSLTPSKSGGQKAVVGIAVVAGLGGVGWLLYKHVYLPGKMKADLLEYAKKQGVPPQDALKNLGKAGCQAFGATYGLPPDASGDICEELSATAANLAREIPGIIGGTLQAGTGALTAVTMLPLQAAAYGVEKIGKGIGAVYGGGKTVLKDSWGVVTGGAKGVWSGTQYVGGGVSTAGKTIWSGAKTVFQPWKW